MLKDMEYVYAVYKEKSFSKAAKKLFISQPALSSTIKKVETRIQVPLFDRSTNPIQLTSAGQYYINSIEKIMEIQENMKSYFDSVSNEKKTSINIGCSAFFCAHILPSLIYKFNLIHPNYKITPIEKNATELASNLQSGDIDIAISVEVLNSPLFLQKQWKKETIVLAVPASYEINNSLKKYRLSFEDIQNRKHLNSYYPSINLSVFKDEPFLFLQKGNDLYNRGMNMCRNADFKPNVKMYLDQLLTSYYVALSGNGVVFIRDEITCHVEPTTKLFFYKIDDDNSMRDIMIYYRKTNPSIEISKDFIKYLDDNIE